MWSPGSASRIARWSFPYVRAMPSTVTTQVLAEPATTAVVGSAVRSTASAMIGMLR